jgi:hypothetical protein
VIDLDDDDSGDDDFASTKVGAVRLAEKIISYWRGRGYPKITAGVVEVTPPKDLRVYNKAGCHRDRRPIYTIVTNIGPRGYPPLRPAT